MTPPRPRLLVAAAAAQAALLAVLAHGQAAPAIAPGDARAHEGLGDVRVAGLVTQVEPAADGTRVRLAAAGAHLDAWVRAEVHLPLGAWVEAAGRVGRVGGTLALFVDGPEGLRTAVPMGVPRPAWADLAAHPEAWRGRPIELDGTVARGRLADGDGHRLALGAGPWPASGPVRATAVLLYDPACLCDTLAASAVAPVA